MLFVTRSLLALFVLAVSLASASVPVLAAGFLPHRAVYSMTLHSSRTGSGIAAVDGEMAVQWVQDCQGWTFDHRSILDITFVESEPVRLSTHASSWESADSTRYIFSLRHAANGDETERVEGTASLRKAGEGGTVEFTAPRAKRIDLPRGTLFPVAHSEAVLDAARRVNDTVTVSRYVFDGMGNDGAFEVNAIVSPAEAPDKPGAAQALSRLAVYRLSLAYFPVDTAEAEPKHEMAMLLYANGVADDLVIDFEDFTVRAVLAKVEMLDVPACRE